jgi:hypothetical protein
MIKIKQTKPEMITLVKGNKKIDRPYIDYKSNQRMWEIRGFKPVEDVVKENNIKEVDKTFENESKVVELKKKKKTRKKKDV